MNYCAHCGSVLQWGDRYCPGCGQALIHEPYRVGYATLEERSKAHIIDISIILLTLFIPIGFGFIPWEYLAVALIVGHWLYASLFVGFWGNSIGMSTMNLEVVGHDLKRIGVVRAAGRHIMAMFSWLSVLGALVSVSHPKRKALHDIIFRTIVVRHDVGNA